MLGELMNSDPLGKHKEGMDAMVWLLATEIGDEGEERDEFIRVMLRFLTASAEEEKRGGMLQRLAENADHLASIARELHAEVLEDGMHESVREEQDD